MPRLAVIAACILIAVAMPAAASPIYNAGSYSVSGTLDNQSLTGTIDWSGSKVLGYTINFGGDTFTCSSKSGLCGLFLKNIKISGGHEILAGLLSPGGSPFTLTVRQGHSDPTYKDDLTWSSVSASEESSLAQAVCLLALFALTIPWAGRLRARKI